MSAEQTAKKDAAGVPPTRNIGLKGWDTYEYGKPV